VIYELTCQRITSPTWVVDRFTDYEVAKVVLERHVLADCPHGAAPWAEPLNWHRTPGHSSVPDRGIPLWVETVTFDGEALDHHLWAYDTSERRTT
jgi:hypothetical protein